MDTLEDFRAVASRVSNWGRWGADDELGTLNFITAQTVRDAAGLVRRGAVFPLGVDFNGAGPQTTLGFRVNPIHLMTVDGGDASLIEQVKDWSANPVAQAVGERFGRGLMRFNDDYVVMPLQAATQWDALSHVYYEDQMYNGFPASAVTSFGTPYLGIEKTDVKGITSRGVLLDVCAHRGVDLLAPGSPVGPEELDEIARMAGVEIRSGDIVLVRTGWWGAFRASGDPTVPASGVSWHCVEWLHRHEVAAIAADNVAVEGIDEEVVGERRPLHCLCLRDMGLMLGELWDLDRLAADCASDGVYEFQLVAPPLRVTGAVGSPLNPVALK